MRPFTRHIHPSQGPAPKPIVIPGPEGDSLPTQAGILSARDKTFILCKTKELIESEYGIYDGVLQYLLDESRITRLRYKKRIEKIKLDRERKFHLLNDPAIHPLDLFYQFREDLLEAMGYGEKVTGSASSIPGSIKKR